MILAAYVDFRMAYPWPIAADSAMLTLLGYLDLGLAEILDRRKQTIYARPVRFSSLILPILPLIQLLWIGGTHEVGLFHLVAAATFYSVACGQLRWKSLGYAAGVFYNAALWVLWSIFGWELTDHFQFFMVPVGFSTILFAESQRHELGRSAVNAIRVGGALDHLRLTGCADLAVCQLRCLAGTAGRFTDRNLPRHRPAVANVPLAGARDVRA